MRMRGLFAIGFAVCLFCCVAETRGEIPIPEDQSTDWGAIRWAERSVHIELDRLPETGYVRLPRLNNPMQSLRWGRPQTDQAVGTEPRDDGPQPTLRPEPDHWRIIVPKSISPPASITLTTVGPLRYCEQPYRIRQSDDQPIVLPAHHAETHGRKLRYEPQQHKNTIGYWTEPADWAEWHFQVTTPGEYRLEVSQGCGSGNGGSHVELVCLGGDQQQTADFVVQDTGHFQNFVARDVGSLRLDRGRYRLQVRARDKAKQAVCDIRRIRLIPR